MQKLTQKIIIDIEGDKEDEWHWVIYNDLGVIINSSRTTGDGKPYEMAGQALIRAFMSVKPKFEEAKAIH